MAPKVWFITGTSKGFGRIWTEAALDRGDKVVATARNPKTLDDLVARYPKTILPLALDVTQKEAVSAIVAQAHDRFGRLDVVINNAGFGLFGTVEEVTAEQARAQMETNFFGALWVTKAVLPILREQRSGHIIQVSSIGGVTAFPTLAMYHASKWALEGFSQALAAEVEEFGIHVTLVEPTGYETDWNGRSSTQASQRPYYDGLRARLSQYFGPVRGRPRGNPRATGAAILKVVDAKKPPLRIFFGSGPLEMMKSEYPKRIATWEEWNEVSQAAEGTPAEK
ncbi:MAG TPA: SDR family oxidoreductase [Polyangia bacterium]|nr:SDR family oxidoreductase [Polyangia bacterium]